MSIVANREQRRQLARDNAKLPAVLQMVPRSDWPEHLQSGPVHRLWRSRDYLVQEYIEAAPVSVRLSILRTTLDPLLKRWVDGISWDDLQRIKSEVGYGADDAVEIYPSDRDVVNVANLRHLWVMAKPVPFAWRLNAELTGASLLASG
jgi:hypothetical protein